MRIGRAAAYAVLAMMALAARADHASGHNGRATAHDLAKHTGVPIEYLRKVLQRLTRARLVRSERGRTGGFHLARPVARVTLLQVVEAIEGPVDDEVILEHAVFDSPDPSLRKLRKWRHHAAERLREILGKTTLADVMTSAGG
jgi:Rrf2 family protein